LSDSIKIPEKLTFEEKEIYLVSYGVHLGDTVGQNAEDYVHYEAYVKTNVGWAEIDDDNVRLLSSEDESSIRRSAYFCLYSTTNISTA
jgi:ubiquitin C-terminal hydrolase